MGQAVVLHNLPESPDDAAIGLLSSSFGDLCASVSPLELAFEQGLRIISPLGYPAPAIPRPNRRVTLVTREVLELLAIPNAPTSDQWFDEFEKRATRFGLQHLCAPGLLIGSSKSPPSDPNDGPRFKESPYLEVHKTHAELSQRELVVLFDGLCLDDDISTGTHQLIVNLIKAFADLSNRTAIWVVAKAIAHPLLKLFLAETENVKIVTKKEWGDQIADVLFRGYQIYSPDELVWCREHARRLIIGQLDMIAYDNRFYFPSLELYSEARNVIRASLLTADAVASISEFARRTVINRVPDLEHRHVEIVFCGTDHISRTPSRRPDGLSGEVNRFVLCLSGSFAHKNRPHAVRTFAHLASGGYTGHLVFAGSSPSYGTLNDLEQQEIAALPIGVRQRIAHLPTLKESSKWWLLEAADAVLYPSVVEGYGLVPFEAASVGTPCLTHRSTAMAEILGPEVLLAESWDPQVWAAIVLGWIDNDPNIQSFLDTVNRRASLFTWRRSAEDLSQLINETVRAPKRAPLFVDGDGGWLEQFPMVSWQQETPQRAIRFVRRAGSYLSRRYLQITNEENREGR
jgi:glycosyltransferase involved in cell wall biosynthesis